MKLWAKDVLGLGDDAACSFWAQAVVGREMLIARCQRPRLRFSRFCEVHAPRWHSERLEARQLGTRPWAKPA